MKLTLKIVYVCDMNHWMSQGGIVEVVGHKEIEVADIDAVKVRHTEVDKGVFSDTVDTYDAVFYDNKPFRLRFDLKTEGWVAVRTIASPRQRAHMSDYVQQAKDNIKAFGMELELAK